MKIFLSQYFIPVLLTKDHASHDSHKEQRLFSCTALTFWRRTFLFQILAHTVFKM